MPPKLGTTLVGVRAKIERAKKNVADLDIGIKSFLSSDPYKVGPYHDPQTGHLLYKVISIDATPWTISILVGEAVQNLRSALDHLAYQLFLAGGAVGDLTKIYFPIGGVKTCSATSYESVLAGKVKGMAQDTINAIRATEPYKGGKGHELWVLHNLNIIDKHRLLITAGTSLRSVNLGAFGFNLYRAEMEAFLGAPIPKIDAYFRSGDDLFPLEVGDVVFSDQSPGAKFDKDTDFRFDIAFNEPEIVEGKPLLESAHHFIDLVEALVTQFVPLLISP